MYRRTRFVFLGLGYCVMCFLVLIYFTSTLNEDLVECPGQCASATTKSGKDVAWNSSQGGSHEAVPHSRDGKPVWPSHRNGSDGILEQLALQATHPTRHQLILLVGLFTESVSMAECPVHQCHVSRNFSELGKADVVVALRNSADTLSSAGPRRPDQVVVWYELESSYLTTFPELVKVNWTATYRTDSTIATPYAKFVPYDNGPLHRAPERNFAAGKSKLVAWFVSNCRSHNGRGRYAQELQKYIDVDIYGACGPLKCSKAQTEECQDMLSRDYKFYLAFENANCEDYITEKFFGVGLGNDVVPIAMGARPEDYTRMAPPHSFIHVDQFESPRQLAEYLKLLDSNDALYNEYFTWKGSGEFINTRFWCRVCAMIHEARVSGTHTWYDDIRGWWAGKGVCRSLGERDSWASWRRNASSGHSEAINPHRIVII